MEDLNIDQVRQRWTSLKTERSSFMSHWQETSRFLLPRSGRFFSSDRNKGGSRHQAIYDNTGTRALRTLSAGMMAGMTSPARPWFRLAIPDQDMAKSHAVRSWLSDVDKLMRRVFSKSNTYQALHTIYEELGAFGTAASIMMPDFNSVLHQYNLTAGEYAIAADWKGRVCTIYREFDCTVGALVKEFGLDACCQSTQSAYSNGNLEKWVTVIHAIEPREDRDPRKRDRMNKPYRSVYFESSAPRGKLLREGGFDEMPALVCRWSAPGGDIYGTGPAMDALGDIKQLQHQQMRKAQGIDYKVTPPLQAPYELKNQPTSLLPGGLSYVTMNGQQAGIRPAFEASIDLSHLLADIQDVRQRVNSAFYADMFLMLANRTDARMTATEVAERHEEKLLMIGPVLERLHNELLAPLVEGTFARMVEAGIVPPPPQEMQGMDIQVEFVSMLAQAQRAVATNSIDRYVSTIGSIAQFKPDILDKIDSDYLADEYADMLGVDPKAIVPGEKVALIRQGRAEAKAKAAAQQDAIVQAEAMSKLGSVSTAGGSNAANDAISMFSGYGVPA